MAEPLPSSLQQVEKTFVLSGKRKLVYFGGCDYFRLASHPKVLAALVEASARYGLNVAASRVTTGNHWLYEQLEQELAHFFGAETAVLLPNGYSTNLAVAQACSGSFSVAFIDQKAHASLQDAARFLECPVWPFRHRDPEDLARLLKRQRQTGNSILLTDGIFSHSGALAPLRAYRKVLSRDATILVDDAHAAGVLGQTGQGTIQYEALPRQGVIQTVTLSKAFGVGGGAVLGPMELRGRIPSRSGAFSGSTPLSLPLAAAAREAVKLLSPGRGLRQRLARNIVYVRESLHQTGLKVSNTPSPILALQPRRAIDQSTVRHALLAAGIHPPWIRYGAGPVQGYFRFAISSEHSREQLEGLVGVLIRCRERLLVVR